VRYALSPYIKQIGFVFKRLISQRLLKGQFHKLYEDLCAYPKKYMGYFRVSKKSFDELLPMIQPYISYQNTNMRIGYRTTRKICCDSEVRKNNCIHTVQLFHVAKQFTKNYVKQQNYTTKYSM
jgi:hypothetical protein